MDGSRLSYPACMIAGQNKIDAQDVLTLRKHVFPQGLASAEDAITLQTLHHSPGSKCPEWATYYVEAMTAFIVDLCWPQGSLDDLNARWIEALIAPEGVVETEAELDFLIHVIDIARSVPDRLSTLAIDQVRAALEMGRGAYASRREVRRQGISEQDVAHVVRILKGACNHGLMTVTKRENKVLVAIDMIVSAELNHPSWRDLMLSIRERGVEDTRRAGPWLRLVHSRDETASLVA